MGDHLPLYVALAVVDLVGRGEAVLDQLVLGRARQPADRIGRALQLGRERHVELPELRGVVDPVDQRPLLDLHLHRFAVDQGGKAKEVGGVLYGDVDVVVVSVDVDVRQREGDGDGDVLWRAVDEAVADPDQFR